MIDAPAVQARLADVRDRIARAARRAGRDPSSIRLVAISKTFGADSVRAAALAGQVDCGENRVQEAMSKIAQTADLQIRWHLVGHLQSNKARKAGGAFDLIHSVDDPELVRRIDEGAAAAGRTVELLVQVDLAGEATKFGAPEDAVPRILAAAEGCRAARIVGLMLLPPAADDLNEVRPFFRRLVQLRDRLLAGGVDAARLRELSMGMSHDFEVAVEEGATMVRVGSAIFGERQKL